MPSGQYPQPRLRLDGRLEIDFKLASNLDCAYDERYFCPIRLKENWLSVPIELGKRRFDDSLGLASKTAHLL